MTEENRLRRLATLFNVFSFRVDSLKNRIILQKVVYLLKKSGLDLGYTYSFYIYGPYSSDLANDAFKISENPELLKDTLELLPANKAHIEKVKSMIKSNECDSTWYELLATTLYLKTEKGLTGEDLYKEVAKHRSYLGDKPRFEKAKKLLSDKGFF